MSGCSHLCSLAQRPHDPHTPEFCSRCVLHSCCCRCRLKQQSPAGQAEATTAGGWWSPSITHLQRTEQNTDRRKLLFCNKLIQFNAVIYNVIILSIAQRWDWWICFSAPQCNIVVSVQLVHQASIYIFIKWRLNEHFTRISPCQGTGTVPAWLLDQSKEAMADKNRTPCFTPEWRSGDVQPDHLS